MENLYSGLKDDAVWVSYLFMLSAVGGKEQLTKCGWVR